MVERCLHFKFADFTPVGESYHFAQPELQADNAARYHDHDFHEIFWVRRGRGEHRLNGAKLPLRAGQLWLVRPADRHAVTGTAAPVGVVNLAFPSRSWAQVRRRYFAEDADPFAAADEQRRWHLDEAAQATLERWRARLDDARRPRVVLDGFLMELPSLLATGDGGSGDDVGPEWLALACREIVRPEHFADGTRGFARLAGRSPAHVARATVRWLGTTPTEIVNAARMEFAARQLAGTARPIMEIALDCGLNNLSHFYALFRRRYGLSPRRYRLRAHGIV